MFGSLIPIHVIDFEGAPAYGVVEYGVASLVDGQIGQTQTRICRAHAPIDASDIAVHGITYADSMRYAPFEEDYNIFVDLRRRGPLAAHNARYEARLMRMAWTVPPIVPAWNEVHTPSVETQLSLRGLEKTPSQQAPRQYHQSATWGPWIDSCALARKLAPGLPRYKLQIVVEQLGLQNDLDAVSIDRCPPNRRMYHCALYDALAAALILKKLLLEAPEEKKPPEAKIFSVKD